MEEHEFAEFRKRLNMVPAPVISGRYTLGAVLLLDEERKEFFPIGNIESVAADDASRAVARRFLEAVASGVDDWRSETFWKEKVEPCIKSATAGPIVRERQIDEFLSRFSFYGNDSFPSEKPRESLQYRPQVARQAVVRPQYG